MVIQFYDVYNRCKVGVPLEQVKKALYKRTTRNGRVQVHYILIAQLNGTILRKLVRRKDWLELDVAQI